MPSLRRKNQWAARVKRDGVDYWLGLYPSYDKALQVEQDFTGSCPSRRGLNTRIQRNGFNPNQPRSVHGRFASYQK